MIIKSIIRSIIYKIIPSRLRRHEKLVQLRQWARFHFFLRKRLKIQLAYATAAQQILIPQTSKRILIPLIETSHYQYLQILIVAKSLQLRGATVKVLVCGEFLDACEIRSKRNENLKDPCFACRFNVKNVLPLFNLQVVRLSDYISEFDREQLKSQVACFTETEEGPIACQNIDLRQSIVDSVIRYFYGNVPKDSKVSLSVMRSHATTALINATVARRIDDNWSPNIVLNSMYCYSAWEPYYRYYNVNGNRFESLSITAFNFNAVVFNSFEIYSSTTRFVKYLKSRINEELTIFERDQLGKFLRERMDGQSRIFIKEQYFNSGVDIEELRSLLKLDLSRRNIFLFSNIYWDVGLSDCSALFSDVITWVLETIEICKTEEQCHLYIKPHPAEVFDSSSSLLTMSQIIRQAYPILPKNVTIIEPEWKVKTYDIFQFIDIGVVFNGTLGLEMMLSGIPVISTGKTSHMGLGLAMEPENREQYSHALLSGSGLPNVDQGWLELFAYFYFILTLLPWTLTKQAYGDNFDGFEIDSLEHLLPGQDAFVDHLCSCIIDPDNAIPEAWQTVQIAKTYLR